MKWIDTHCHLDAGEFGERQASLALADAAAQGGVDWVVIPAIAPFNFQAVAGLAQDNPHCVYALGIHPVLTPTLDPDEALARLRLAATTALDDPRFIAIGEIGLDYFVPALKEPDAIKKQEYIFQEQLKLARDLSLPVLLHVRRSQDRVLKYLRQIQVSGGIAHAFNGSDQQAEAFIKLNFALGFGGAMTFPRALQIRRLAANVPETALVLETDAPDLPPEWLNGAVNRPQEIPAIGRLLADLRGISNERIASLTSANACRVLPRLGALQRQSDLQSGHTT